MRRLFILLATLLITGASISIPAASTHASSHAGIQAAESAKQRITAKKIDSYLKGLANQNKFSGVVLVAQNGTILLSKGYGMADKETKVRNTPTTKYAAPGVTFSMSLIAGLRLEEQGKLHDTDLVCSFLSTCPAGWKPMTVGMVLDGTSGLPDSAWESQGQTVDDTLASCQTQPLTAAPGVQLFYGNCTGIVLGLIYEKTTGKPWATVIHDTILAPAHMTHSGRLTDALVPPERARDYSGGNPDPSTRYNTYFAVYSTLQDVYAYDQALFAGKIISKRSLARMSAGRSVTKSLDPGIANNHVAFFWNTARAFGHSLIYTTSNIHSFTAANLRFPKDVVTVITLSNDDQSDVVGAAVHAAALVFGAKPPRTTTAPAGPPPLTVDPAKAIQATVNVDAGCTIESNCYPNGPIVMPGALWAAMGGTGKSVHVNSSTNTASTVTVVQQAYDANAGTDTQTVAAWNGEIWTTDLANQAIARIDPKTDRVVETIPVNMHGALLAVWGDTMWIAGADTPHQPLERFDLHTRKVVATIPDMGQIFALLPTSDAVWASLWDTSEVVRIDPATNQIVGRFKVGTNPQALALGDGSLWVANGWGHYLTRIDPATGKIQATIPLDSHGDARDGAPWCACQAVTVDSGGVWAIAHDNHSLVHIDPQTNRVTSSLTLSQAPGGAQMQPWDVVSGEGSLWVTATPHLVLRIDPMAMLTP